jgi:hypothetical protein
MMWTLWPLGVAHEWTSIIGVASWLVRHRVRMHKDSSS